MLQTVVSESCRDICPILKDAAALKAVIDLFEEHVRNMYQHVDLIVGKKNKSRALKLLHLLKASLTHLKHPLSQLYHMLGVRKVHFICAAV